MRGNRPGNSWMPSTTALNNCCALKTVGSIGIENHAWLRSALGYSLYSLLTGKRLYRDRGPLTIKPAGQLHTCFETRWVMFCLHNIFSIHLKTSRHNLKSPVVNIYLDFVCLTGNSWMCVILVTRAKSSVCENSTYLEVRPVGSSQFVLTETNWFT